jgi:hypothetical protein
MYVSSSAKVLAFIYYGDISNGEGIVLESTDRGRAFTQLKCIVCGGRSSKCSWINAATVTTAVVI